MIACAVPSMRFFLVAVVLSFVACGPAQPMDGPTMNNKMNPDPPPSSVISQDILARTKADAEKLVQSLMAQIAGGADFDTLMIAHSEDPGALTKPDGYLVSPDAQLVLEFRQLGLRLNVGEVGVVQSDYGFHIMKREE